MWKRIGGLSASIFVVISCLWWTSAVMGACGVAPQAPPGGFIWPLQGALTTPWGYDCQTDRGHRGIDLTASGGSQVSAAAAGVVSFVGYTPAEGGGNTITIDHAGGLRSTYLHVSEPAVTTGQTLSAGDPIGISTDGRLHFGIKIPNGGHDTYFDPLDLLPPMPATPSTTPPGEQIEPAPGDTVSEPVTPSPSPAPGPIPAPVAPPVDVPGMVAAITTAPQAALTPVPDVAIPENVSAARSTTSMITAESTIPESLPPLLSDGAAPLNAPLPVPGVFDEMWQDETAPEGAAPPPRRLLNTHGSANRVIAAAAALLASALAGAGSRLTNKPGRFRESLPAAL